METAADYDAMVGELIASGTISDPGMVYFDIRPSAHLPTVELRVCDACPQVDDVVLIAGLFRALVGRARADLDAGLPLPASRHELLRAASWRAARSGLEGDLVDLVGPSLVAPPILIGQLVDQLRPQLEATGDWEQVLELSQATLSRGSGAAGQRRAYGRRGELTDVVDALLAHTQGRIPTHEPPITVPIASELLTAYHAQAYDEAVSQGGQVLPHYGWMFRALDRMGRRGLAAAQSALHSEQRARGVTFRVGDGAPDRLFPLDLVPRIVTAEDWAELTAGPDSAGAGAGGLRPRRLHRPPDRHRRGAARPGSSTTRPVGTGSASCSRRTRCASRWPASTWCATSAERWLVLEDNLRVPSGIGYSIMSRRLIRSVMPDLEPPAGVVGLEAVPGQLRAALLSANEPDEPVAEEVALLSAGPADSAYFEHRLLADRMGVPLVTPRELQVTEDGVYLVGHRGQAAVVGAVPPPGRARPAAGRRAPTCGRSGGPSATRRPAARWRCSTRWATGWPTTSGYTPTSRR